MQIQKRSLLQTYLSNPNKQQPKSQTITWSETKHTVDHHLMRGDALSKLLMEDI